MLLADAVIRSHSLDKFVVPSKQVVRAAAFSEGRSKEVRGDRNALRHPGFQPLPLGNTVECLLRPRRDNGLVEPVRLRVDPEKDAPVRLSCEAERLAHDSRGRRVLRSRRDDRIGSLVHDGLHRLADCGGHRAVLSGLRRARYADGRERIAPAGDNSRSWGAGPLARCGG